jgi:hypothetical protein
MSRAEILGELDRVKDKLKEKEPLKSAAELNVMKLKFEVKELKNKQSTLKKQLKELPIKDNSVIKKAKKNK